MVGLDTVVLDSEPDGTIEGIYVKGPDIESERTLDKVYRPSHYKSFTLTYQYYLIEPSQKGKMTFVDLLTGFI